MERIINSWSDICLCYKGWMYEKWCLCCSQSGFREDRARRRSRHLPGGEINTNTKTRILPKFRKLHNYNILVKLICC